MTKIKFDLSKSGSVRLVIYDISGKEIFVLYNGYLNAGEKEFTFDGSGFSSGIYFYKLTAGSFSETKKMILNK
ncbi:MAG: T9SS type A sorting domain-containing protein [Ignavibacteria bacterium]|nr:T9SS type A sorting domain-containing protein [Ignavibacteria bacterium]